MTISICPKVFVNQNYQQDSNQTLCEDEPFVKCLRECLPSASMLEFPSVFILHHPLSILFLLFLDSFHLVPELRCGGFVRNMLSLSVREAPDADAAQELEAVSYGRHINMSIIFFNKYYILHQYNIL